MEQAGTADVLMVLGMSLGAIAPGIFFIAIAGRKSRRRPERDVHHRSIGRWIGTYFIAIGLAIFFVFNVNQPGMLLYVPDRLFRLFIQLGVTAAMTILVVASIIKFQRGDAKLSKAIAEDEMLHRELFDNQEDEEGESEPTR